MGCCSPPPFQPQDMAAYDKYLHGGVDDIEHTESQLHQVPHCALLGWAGLVGPHVRSCCLLHLSGAHRA